MAIDSKLRGCDLVSLPVGDISQGGRAASRAIIVQQKTKRPVQFEITEQTRTAVSFWIGQSGLGTGDYLFPSRIANFTPLNAAIRQDRECLGRAHRAGFCVLWHPLDAPHQSHADIYRRTKNLRAIQLLLGHTKLESTVRYLGIEVDDALEIAEQTEV
jgi:integrase